MADTPKHLQLRDYYCIKCGLPNPEAETRPKEPCHHCRHDRKQVKDAPYRTPEDRAVRLLFPIGDDREGELSIEDTLPLALVAAVEKLIEQEGKDVAESPKQKKQVCWNCGETDSCRCSIADIL